MRRAKSGVSLIEMVIAVALGLIVMAAGIDILSFGVRNQIDSTRLMRLQGDAFLAWRAVEVEVRQATEILSPANVGAASDTLTGCGNADVRTGALDPALPVTGFMFCERAGKVYYYRFSPATCPMASLPACAARGGLVVADKVSHLPGASSYYTRPAPGQVRIAYQTAASGQSQEVDVTVAFNAASGAGQ